MTKKITIKEMAEKLGLAPSTVSLALKDFPGISEETRKKVKDLARELGYMTDEKNLTREKHGLVGVIVRDLSSFVPELIKGIEYALEENDSGLLLRSHRGDPKRLKDIAKFMKNKKVGGVIIATGVADYPRIAKEILGDLPIVVVSGAVIEIEDTLITVDGFEGTFKATVTAIEEVTRRKNTRPNIVFISGPEKYIFKGIETDFPPTAERKGGYEIAMKSHGLEPVVFHADYSVESGYETFKKILKHQKPDAVVASADYIAIGAMRAALEEGYRIPEDISFIGFDDLPVCDMVHPPLSSVRIPAVEMGKIAVSVLGRSIREKIILKPEIVRRKSL